MSSRDLPDNSNAVLDIFSRISAVPRPSGKEKQIAAWVMARAQKSGFDSVRDSIGNVVVRVPESPGYEASGPVILQSHLDMVCEKNPESNHDFSSDPIRLVVEGDWLQANGTTLGADNGIGMAIAIALAEDRFFRHPGLELLFTVEEETGLSGAQNLDAKMLQGRTLINIDSEQEGTFTIGCAGGENGRIDLPVSREDIPESYTIQRLDVSGLRGGHSGMNIGEKRGNANKILVRILGNLFSRVPLQLISLDGGTRSNVIPRDAVAILALQPDSEEKVRCIVDTAAAEVAKEYAHAEKGLSITLAPGDLPTSIARAFSAADSRRCLRLLDNLPHGVHQWSTELEGAVETSNNLAIVHTDEEAVHILCFQRSSKMTELQTLTSHIGVLAARHGARFHRNGFYPGWEPRMDSPLLAHCQKVFKKIHKREAKVTLTHGGLECGILGSKLPNLDMISLGPTIENPHSPQERVHVPSILGVYDFLKELLTSFAS